MIGGVEPQIQQNLFVYCLFLGESFYLAVNMIKVSEIMMYGCINRVSDSKTPNCNRTDLVLRNIIHFPGDPVMMSVFVELLICQKEIS